MCDDDECSVNVNELHDWEPAEVSPRPVKADGGSSGSTVGGQLLSVNRDKARKVTA